MIEVLPLSTGRLLISVGPHCVETDSDDRAIDHAIAQLAEQSGQSAQRIAVVVARETMA